MYHKDAESYLCYDPMVSAKPMFMSSTRVSSKSRKKTSWLWKIEKDTLLRAGEPIVCESDSYYRIRHVATDLFLCKGQLGGLELESNYNTPMTLWTFKSLHKAVQAQGPAGALEEGVSTVKSNTLVYVRSKNGGWLTHQGGAPQNLRVNPYEQGRFADAGLRLLDTPSERDALRFLPARAEDVKAIVEMNRRVAVLNKYQKALEYLPNSTAEYVKGALMPETLEIETEQVLDIVQRHYADVTTVLTELVVALTPEDENTAELMQRKGSPDVDVQKLVRELQIIHLSLDLLSFPLAKGVNEDWLPEPRCHMLRDIYMMIFCVLKFTVMGNELNSLLLMPHVQTFQLFMGKGIAAMETIREVYGKNRVLLSHIDEDQVLLYISMMEHQDGKVTTVAVRAVSFLTAMCSCDGQPITKNQEIICKLLFDQLYLHTIPCFNVTWENLTARLTVQLSDRSGKMTASVSAEKYAQKKEDASGHMVELCEEVMEQDVNKLDDDALIMVYGMRMLELLAEISLGRNQNSLGLILRNKDLGVEYPQILQAMFSPAIPIAMRARYVRLMQRLYLDRDPQTSKPQVQRTRAWKEVELRVTAPANTNEAKVASFRQKARSNMLSNINLGVTQVLPVCTTGFEDLSAILLRTLPTLGGIINDSEAGKHRLNSHTTVGQIDYARELIDLTDLMLDFYVMAPDRDKVMADFYSVQTIISVVFSIVNVAGTAQHEMLRSRQASGIALLRTQALNVLWRIFNMRGNHRISLAVAAWEQLFDTMVAEHGGEDTNLAHIMALINDREAWVKSIQPFLAKLSNDMFDVNHISPPQLDADLVVDHGGKTSLPVQSLLALFCASAAEPQLSTMALKCLFKQVLQKPLALLELSEVQLLTYPEAVKLNNEADHAIRRLTALKKHLYSDRDEAYKQVNELVNKLTEFILPSETVSADIVSKNQTILLNREMDEPVANLLSLELKRRRARNGIAPDAAVNDMRRNMFKTVYRFLGALARGNEQAQEKLHPLVGVFSDHLGIEGLPVSTTIGEIFRNNPTLLTQVKTRFLGRFVELIHKHGREARWMQVLKVFLQIDGRPFKRCQDLIVNLLMEDTTVLDMDCDFTTRRNSEALRFDDWRKGMSRRDLMRRREQQMEHGSLLKYHASCVEVLSMCSAGKNPTAKAMVSSFVSLNQIVCNFLDPENPFEDAISMSNSFDGKSMSGLSDADSPVMSVNPASAKKAGRNTWLSPVQGPNQVVRTPSQFSLEGLLCPPLAPPLALPDAGAASRASSLPSPSFAGVHLALLPPRSFDHLPLRPPSNPPPIQVFRSLTMLQISHIITLRSNFPHFFDRLKRLKLQRCIPVPALPPSRGGPVRRWLHRRGHTALRSHPVGDAAHRRVPHQPRKRREPGDTSPTTTVGAVRDTDPLRGPTCIVCIFEGDELNLVAPRVA